MTLKTNEVEHYMKRWTLELAPEDNDKFEEGGVFFEKRGALCQGLVKLRGMRVCEEALRVVFKLPKRVSHIIFEISTAPLANGVEIVRTDPERNHIHPKGVTPRWDGEGFYVYDELWKAVRKARHEAQRRLGSKDVSVWIAVMALTPCKRQSQNGVNR